MRNLKEEVCRKSHAPSAFTASDALVRMLRRLLVAAASRCQAFLLYGCISPRIFLLQPAVLVLLK